MDDTPQFVSNVNMAGFVGRLRAEHGDVQREVIEGRARVAIQIALVETLTANGQDVRLAESMLSSLIEIQKTIEQYRQIIVDAMERNRHVPPN